jgi:hypothetical protein
MLAKLFDPLEAELFEGRQVAMVERKLAGTASAGSG